jgi:hypothetical protein
MTAENEASVFGLVHSGTSDTQPIEIDPTKQRWKKLRCATITGARLIEQQLSQGGQRTFPVMITLTYSPRVLWSSRHVSDFLKISREWFRRRGRKFYYAWVAELMKNGMVHFHVIVWMPKGYRLPKPDKHGWWPHGMTRIEGARNPVGYIAKYCSKTDQPNWFPKGLRTHGRGGLDVTSRIEARWWSSPGWVRKWCSSITDVRRVTGGGFVCVDTGEWQASPWHVVFSAGRVHLISLLAYQRPDLS